MIEKCLAFLLFNIQYVNKACHLTRVKSRDSAKLSATTVATIGVPLYACGGGTVAKYMAKRNIDTIDAGVPVLSMHSPYELTAKFDCYMTYKAVKSMYDSKN